MKKRYAIYKKAINKKDKIFIDSKETKKGAENLLEHYCDFNMVDKKDLLYCAARI